jgi:hypothetical protein
MFIKVTRHCCKLAGKDELAVDKGEQAERNGTFSTYFMKSIHPS